MKSVRIRSYSGPYFPAFGLNTDQNNSEYGHFLDSVMENENCKLQFLLKQQSKRSKLKRAIAAPKKRSVIRRQFAQTQTFVHSLKSLIVNIYSRIFKAARSAVILLFIRHA